MDYYAGTDVSLEQSSVCVVDAAGKIVCEAKVASEPDREHQKPWGMSQTCAPAAVGSGPCASRIAVDRSTSSASGFSRYPTVFDALLGDGGYDRTGVYTALDERYPDAKVIVPPRA